jgi:hypothetical protein
MATFLYHCPNTGFRVQGWSATDGSQNCGDVYEGVRCLACSLVHLVNPETGRILGADNDD